jgi:hypothetical protein
MTLLYDLTRYLSRIAGRLVTIVGPFKDRRGIYYKCGGKVFRSWATAVRFRDKHNGQVRKESR